MFSIPAAYIGHVAGLTTSGLWTGTSLCFTAATRRLGPTRTNAVRLVMAVILLAAMHRLVTGVWVPGAVGGQVLLLAASGLVGLTIGDQALFTAFMQLGPRLVMLIETTAPLFAALFGWLALGETIALLGCLGIALTVGGVGWVVLERPAGPTPWASGRRARGVMLAVFAAICQAGGLLLSKQGMGHGWLPTEQHLRPLSATLVRMSFAAVGMVPFVLFYWMRERRERAAGVYPVARAWRAGLLFAFAGAFGGPFLGVWMSLVAADHAPVGVAQTLMALPPVLILPLARVIYKEHISVRAVLGAVVAVGGVALLFVAR
jgi:drug/metabolite transporter (DMT)-like permease